MSNQRLRDYLSLSLAVVSRCRSLLLRLYQHFSECPIPTLIILAILFHLIARFMSETLRSPALLKWAKGIGLLAILACSLYAYFTEQLDTEDLSDCLTFGMRASLAFFVVEGSVALVYAPVELLWRAVAGLCRQLGQVIGTIGAALFRIRFPRRPIKPLSCPPAPSLQTLLAQAKQEFESRCQTLQSTGLDEVEIESALLLARQRYLRRLHELTQS